MIAIALGIVVSAFAISPATADKIPVYATDEAELEEARQNVEAAKNKLDEINGQISQIQQEKSDTQTYIATLDGMASSLTSDLNYTYTLILNKQAEIENKQAEIDAKQIEIDTKQVSINTTEANIAAKEAELDEAYAEQQQRYEAMSLRIKYMYESGESSFLELIFSSESLEEMLGRSEYINQVTEYDRAQLQQLADLQTDIKLMVAQLEIDKANLESEKSALEAEKVALEEQKVALQGEEEILEINKQSYSTQLETVDAVMAEKQATLANLNSGEEYAEEAKRLAEQYLADSEAIYAQLKALWEAEQAKGTTDADTAARIAEIGLSGGFAWPLPYPDIGLVITSPYGMRLHPILGDWRLHDGVDISSWCIYGTEIKAIYSGTVIMAEYYGGYGNCVQIDHGCGVVSLYAHQSSMAVSVGQYVEKGQTIGYVGSTGNSTGAHLHLSLFIAGQSVQPIDYVFIPSYVNKNGYY